MRRYYFIVPLLTASLAILVSSCGKKPPLIVNGGNTVPVAPPQVPIPAIIPLSCEVIAPAAETHLFVDEMDRLFPNFTPPAINFTVRLKRGSVPVLGGSVVDSRSASGGLGTALPPQTGNNGDVTAFIRATALGAQTIDFLVADKNGERAQCSGGIRVVGRRPDPLVVNLLVDGSSNPKTIAMDEKVTLTVFAPQARACELIKNGNSLGAINRLGDRMTDPHANPGALPIDANYSILCTAENSPATQTASVRVTVNPKPTATLAVTALVDGGIGRKDSVLAYLKPATPFRVAWSSQFAKTCTLNNAAVLPVNSQDSVALIGSLDLLLECFDGKNGTARVEARLRLPPVPAVRINGFPTPVQKSSMTDSVTISWDGSGSDSCQLINRSINGTTGSISVNRESFNQAETFTVSCITAGIVTTSTNTLNVDCSRNELIGLRTLGHYLNAKTIPVRNTANRLPAWMIYKYNPQGNYEVGPNIDGIENSSPAISGFQSGDAVSITRLTGKGAYIANVGPYEKNCNGDLAYPFTNASYGSISNVQFVGANGKPVQATGSLTGYHGSNDENHFRVDSMNLLNIKFPVPAGAVALHTTFVDILYNDNGLGCTFDFAVYGCRANSY